MKAAPKTLKPKRQEEQTKLYQLAFCVACAAVFCWRWASAGSRGPATGDQPDMLVPPGRYAFSARRKSPPRRGMITDLLRPPAGGERAGEGYLRLIRKSCTMPAVSLQITAGRRWPMR